MNNYFDFDSNSEEQDKTINQTSNNTTNNKKKQSNKKKQPTKNKDLQIQLLELEEQLETINKSNEKAFNKKLETCLKNISKTFSSKKSVPNYLRDFFSCIKDEDGVSKANSKRVRVIGDSLGCFDGSESQQEDHSEDGKSSKDEIEKVNEENNAETEEKEQKERREEKNKLDTKTINSTLLIHLKQSTSTIPFLKSLTNSQVKEIPTKILLKCLYQDSPPSVDFYINLFTGIDYKSGIWEANYLNNKIIDSDIELFKMFYLINNISDQVSFKSAYTYFMTRFVQFVEFDKSELEKLEMDSLSDTLVKEEFLTKQIIGDFYHPIGYKGPFGDTILLKEYVWNRKLEMLDTFCIKCIENGHDLIALMIYKSILNIISKNEGCVFPVDSSSIDLRCKEIVLEHIKTIERYEYFYKIINVDLELLRKDGFLQKCVVELADSYKKFDRNVLKSRCRSKGEMLLREIWKVMEIGDEKI